MAHTRTTLRASGRGSTLACQSGGGCISTIIGLTSLPEWKCRAPKVKARRKGQAVVLSSTRNLLGNSLAMAHLNRAGSFARYLRAENQEG
jgi:hypothetical protein